MRFFRQKCNNSTRHHQSKHKVITKLRWIQAKQTISSAQHRRTHIHHNANYNTFYYLSNGSFELPRDFFCAFRAKKNKTKKILAASQRAFMCMCVRTFGNYVWLHWNIITLKHWIFFPNKRLMSGYINDRNMCADFFLLLHALHVVAVAIAADAAITTNNFWLCKTHTNCYFKAHIIKKENLNERASEWDRER